MSYPPEQPLFIRPHCGLGDSIILNGLVRHFAAKRPVIFPVKHHNVPSVRFMFRDDPNIRILPVKDDAEADSFSARAQDVLKLGMFGDNFSFKEWDRIFYTQAGLPFDLRWSGFQVERELGSELMPPKRPFAFVHEDSLRGMVIEDAKLPGIQMILAEKQPTIFSYCRVIEEAEEIHCIDSIFAILADSIPTRAKRLVLHLYARAGARPPTYKKPWEILR